MMPKRRCVFGFSVMVCPRVRRRKLVASPITLPGLVCTPLFYQRFLLWFSVDEEYTDFVLEELDNLLVLNGVDPTAAYRRGDVVITDSPFVVVDVPSVDVMQRIGRRSVLLHHAMELVGEGVTYVEVRAVDSCVLPRVGPSSQRCIRSVVCSV